MEKLHGEVLPLAGNADFAGKEAVNRAGLARDSRRQS